MKKIIFLITVMTLSLGAFAEQTPKVITDAFQQKFAGAGNVKWEKETEKGFDVTFELGGKKMAASFSAQGQWTVTNTDVGLDGLPAVARVVLQTRFMDWDISTVNKIDKADNTQLFLARLVKDKVIKEVLIKPNGDIVK